VGLVPYAEEDWELFFGREAEIELITANLVASRLTLLFGASGVGKSSVIRAGVAHHLAEQARRNVARGAPPEIAIAVVSAWRDEPLEGLVRAVRDGVARATGRDPAALPASGRLAATFAGWAELVGGDIMVVLDQFEEYFLYHDRQDGPGTFAVEFPRLLATPELRMNFLVPIRDDAVARLDRFKGRIPSLFDNYLRLRHLGPKAAEDAIRKPLAAFNRQHPGVAVEIEDALVHEVLRQTRRGRVPAGRSELVPLDGAPIPAATGDDADEIETPYLQMVMTRLWEEEHAAGSRTLRRATFVESPPAGLGGADRIVRTHLDGEMARLDPTEQDVAVEAFRVLVNRTGTKIALAVDDLAGYTALPAARLAPVLEKLAAGGRRILRPVAIPERADAVRYEIFHDVLGPTIADWRRRHQAVQEQAAIRREQEERRLDELRRAEDRRRRERSRYLAVGLVVLSIGFAALLAVSWIAVKQSRIAMQQSREAAERAEQARAARALAERSREAAVLSAQLAEEQRRTAILARERAEQQSLELRLALQQLQQASKAAEAGARAAIGAAQTGRGEPPGATAASELRQVFIGGDTGEIRDTARRLGLLNEQVRFRARRVAQDYQIEQGQVYEYSLEPVAGSVPGGLGRLVVVTFKMDHPTFRNKLLVGDPQRGFRATYIGWGCLSVVPVLLEYADPRQPPQVAMFEMCGNVETSRSPARSS
jgi:hypothetical protein